ncbi:MAG: hypothetical protein JXR96_14780 [Deltaproteobacteria bacterium]|nr:hypothetical protein [Deltaproteobacteria bacterium]
MDRITSKRYRHMSIWTPLALLALLAGCSQGAPGPVDGGGDGDAGWEPPVVYEDLPFIQERATVLGQLADVQAIAIDDEGAPVAVAAGQALRFDGQDWQALDLGLAEVRDLFAREDGALIAVGPDGLSTDGQVTALPAGAQPSFVGPRRAGGSFVAGQDMAGYVEADSYVALDGLSGARAIADADDGAWCAATDQGVLCSGGVAYGTDDGLPSDEVRALAFGPDGTIWAGTDAGLAHRDPASSTWVAMLGVDGLHYHDVLDIEIDAEGVLLVATRKGASTYATDGQRRYYFGRIWLPHDEVRALARSPDGGLVFATAGGVSRVERVEMTLAEKAALFDSITASRHVRMGYTSTECHLREAGDLTSFYSTDDDNDGQWTGMYLASQCFRYAVTQEPEARANADRAADAMLALEAVTGVPGFFARSIVPGDECEAKQAGPGEWHLSGDGVSCFKTNTSSDEYVGHVFGLSLYHDLVADEDGQARVAATFTRIHDRLIADGYKIVDLDGEPTDDGHFDPEWMETDLGAMFGDAGLNSAMILGGLRAVFHMTGEQRFADAFDYLAHERGYADYVSRIEEINTAWHINHDSEEMSFLAMYTLMRYETDPARWQLWRQGLDYLWEVQRPERDPEFNIIFAALARSDLYDLDTTIETLQKLPCDLVLWGLDLQHRDDADPSPLRDRQGRLQNKSVFPYDERQAMRWAENPYAFEMRGDGHAESSGTFWLLPYWMGRYHGFID